MCCCLRGPPCSFQCMAHPRRNAEVPTGKDARRTPAPSKRQSVIDMPGWLLLGAGPHTNHSFTDSDHPGKHARSACLGQTGKCWLSCACTGQSSVIYLIKQLHSL